MGREMMDSLLTSKDIENRIFKKSSFGGYVVAEVDEFLDQISEDMDIYVVRIMELEHRAGQLEMRLKSYDDVRDSLQETLFAAQRTAKQIVAESHRSVAENEAEAANMIAVAREEAQKIVREAEDVLRQSHVEREKVIRDAEFDARDIKNSISRMVRERNDFIATSESLINDYHSMLRKHRETELN